MSKHKVQYSLHEGGTLFEFENLLPLDSLKKYITKNNKLPDGTQPNAILFYEDKTRWDIGIGFSPWDWWFDLPVRDNVKFQKA